MVWDDSDESDGDYSGEEGPEPELSGSDEDSGASEEESETDESPNEANGDEIAVEPVAAEEVKDVPREPHSRPRLERVVERGVC